MDVNGRVEEVGFDWGERVILLIILSLTKEDEDFCFWGDWGGSVEFLLILLTGSASCSSSLSDVGRIKSHSPWNSTNYSSWYSSADDIVSSWSSSWSDSTYKIIFGGWEAWFLLKYLKKFFIEDSTTCFFISTISFDIVLRNFCNP